MTSTPTLWLTLIGMGLLTYALRLSFIELWGRLTLPPAVQRSLRFVPPAVLAALLFPEVLLRNGALDMSLHNLRLLAALLAVLVAWRTRNTLLTIAAGMAALWLLQLLLASP